MSYRPPPFLVSGLVIAAVLIHRPLRQAAVTVFRFPLTVAETCLRTLLQLPRLSRLQQENADLRAELARRQLEFARLQEVVRHGERAAQLRQAVGGASGPLAAIIGRTIFPTQHTVILDKGSRDGVMREGLLLDAGGVVGQVLEAYPAASLAMLLTDPNSRIACLVERSRESGLLVGTGGPLCQLRYLDAEADVMAEDRIITAGLGGPFPKGLAVGKVVKVARDEASGRAVVWVRPAVTSSQIEEVLCVPPADQPVKSSP